MNLKTLMSVALLVFVTRFAFGGEWHEGNLLNSGDNKTWLEASADDRLATAASTVASMYYNEYLKPEYHRVISGTDVNTMRPLATELMVCIDTAVTGMAENGMTVLVKYSDLAIGCVVEMGWVKL